MLGHPEIWSEPIDNLPWFGELPGYPGQRWFGSEFHRFHHRFGYGGTAPVPMAQPGGAIVNIGGYEVSILLKSLVLMRLSKAIVSSASWT